jgi:hypothetical protein
MSVNGTIGVGVGVGVGVEVGVGPGLGVGVGGPPGITRGSDGTDGSLMPAALIARTVKVTAVLAGHVKKDSVVLRPGALKVWPPGDAVT